MNKKHRTIHIIKKNQLIQRFIKFQSMKKSCGYFFNNEPKMNRFIKICSDYKKN